MAANLNFTAGYTVSNRAMVKLGAGGKVTIYHNAGGTDVVVDIGGTYTDGSVDGQLGGYAPLVPARILDTRTGAPIPAGGTMQVQVAGRGGVPAEGARAVILSVAVTQPAGPGYLTIFSSGTAQPLASDLNYAAGEARANLVVVQWVRTARSACSRRRRPTWCSTWPAGSPRPSGGRGRRPAATWRGGRRPRTAAPEG